MNSSDDTLFRVKSDQAYLFKLLAELLQNNLKTACFEICSSGITLKSLDTNDTLFMNISLQAKEFNYYRFSPPVKTSSTLLIGINVNHLHKLLKCVKKKDSIEISIYNNALNDIEIKIIPQKDCNKLTINYIKNIPAQKVSLGIDEDADESTDYSSVLIASSDISKLSKDLSTFEGKTFEIQSNGRHVKFITNADITGRIIIFGNIHDTTGKIISKQFENSVLSKISKISGLSGNLHLTLTDDFLIFHSRIGTLGNITIHIRPMEN